MSLKYEPGTEALVEVRLERPWSVDHGTSPSHPPLHRPGSVSVLATSLSVFDTSLQTRSAGILRSGFRVWNLGYRVQRSL